ncbi:extracellular solute-binding protein [Actinokineospora soli]|uniref:Extracellular solute-binding protein n=1 Tax=Actinokineospora soli TaxID=1048753 RepID=A0ABW2TIH7_9PSEU
MTVKLIRLLIAFVVGVVLTLAATQYVLPALAGGDDGMEPGELRILSGLDQSENTQRKALVDQWNVLHPENRATIDELPANADQAHSQMVAQAQSGDSGVDIYNIDVTWTAEFAEAGYIQPLDGVDTSGFLDKPLRTCWYEGKLWALPFNTDAGLLYYRTDVVKDVPSTWSGVTAAIKEGKPEGVRTGLATQLADYEGLTVAVMEAVWAAGGDVVDADGAVALDSEAAQSALRRLAEQVRDPEVNLAESLEADESASTQTFRDGHAVFMRNWPVAYRALAAESTEPLPFSAVPLPGNSVLGGQNLAISARSENPAAARALIEFLTDPRSQQILFERGGLPATRDIIYLDPAITQRYPYARSLLSSIENARLRPITPHYTTFSQRLRSVVRALLIDGSLPPDYVDQLTRALEGR